MTLESDLVCVVPFDLTLSFTQTTWNEMKIIWIEWQALCWFVILIRPQGSSVAHPSWFSHSSARGPHPDRQLCSLEPSSTRNARQRLGWRYRANMDCSTSRFQCRRLLLFVTTNLLPWTKAVKRVGVMVTRWVQGWEVLGSLTGLTEHTITVSRTSCGQAVNSQLPWRWWSYEAMHEGCDH
jgi:hypothetical protein